MASPKLALVKPIIFDTMVAIDKFDILDAITKIELTPPPIVGKTLLRVDSIMQC